MTETSVVEAFEVAPTETSGFVGLVSIGRRAIELT
jgi:hypothetical protein